MRKKERKHDVKNKQQAFKMTAHLPVFVIIISVPSSWNLAQRSFVSSLHLTSHIDVEHGGDVDVGESERTDVKALPSLGERRSSLNESLSESSTEEKNEFFRIFNKVRVWAVAFGLLILLRMSIFPEEATLSVLFLCSF